jgi:hypothetical protein
MELLITRICTGDAEAPAHDRLLRMQAVFGLVEDHRMRAVHHLGGDLLAAMGGQAMHEQRVGLACAISASLTW